MANSELLRVQPDIIVNTRSIAYIELTGKGGANYFVGKGEPLHLNPNEAEVLRDYVSGDQVSDTSNAARVRPGPEPVKRVLQSRSKLSR
jgi:hypothetical protein